MVGEQVVVPDVAALADSFVTARHVLLVTPGQHRVLSEPPATEPDGAPDQDLDDSV